MDWAERTPSMVLWRNHHCCLVNTDQCDCFKVSHISASNPYSHSINKPNNGFPGENSVELNCGLSLRPYKEG